MKITTNVYLGPGIPGPLYTRVQSLPGAPYHYPCPVHNLLPRIQGPGSIRDPDAPVSSIPGKTRVPSIGMPGYISAPDMPGLLALPPCTEVSRYVRIGYATAGYPGPDAPGSRAYHGPCMPGYISVPDMPGFWALPPCTEVPRYVQGGYATAGANTSGSKPRSLAGQANIYLGRSEVLVELGRPGSITKKAPNRYALRADQTRVQLDLLTWKAVEQDVCHILGLRAGSLGEATGALPCLLRWGRDASCECEVR